MSYVSAASDATFDAEVLNAGRPTVVTVWRYGCPPCKRLVPQVIELAGEMTDVKFVLMNSTREDNQNTKHRFGIDVCPMLLVFFDKQLVGRWLGAMPDKAKTRAWIERTLHHA